MTKSSNIPKHLIYIFLMIFYSNISYADSKVQVSGIVLEENNLTPMKGVTIKLKKFYDGKSFFSMGRFKIIKQTVTNSKGRFEFCIEMNPKDKFQINSLNVEKFWGGGIMSFAAKDVFSGKIKMPIKILHKLP